jgi:glutamyl-tRNA reductase
LGRVAAGLESMILGEPEILGQVAEAYSVALRQGAAGSVLSALFRAAIHAGKRARAETGISRNAATISSVAVKMAEEVVGPLAERQVLVVGAGQMAESAVEALRNRGASQITVVNRTRTRAVQLAKRWGARALTFEQLGEALAAADIALTSTGAPHFVITAELAQAALAARPARPLVLIDIAVPRDVDPEVRRLPNTHYYDIDDIQAHLNGALAERQQEVPRVEAIVAEETRDFLDWFGTLEIAPLIVDLRAKAEAIRRAEVEKTLRRLPQLGEAERRLVETMTAALVNKLLHDPTQRLKAAASSGYPAEYAAAARYLFALDI